MLIGCGSNQAKSRQSAASEANKADTASSVPQQANSTDRKVHSATIETQRKVIQHATLTQKVTGFDTAMQKIQQLMAQSSGFIQSSSLKENEDSLREASYILRFPEGKYGSILGEIQKIGRTAFITQKGDDVTQEYYDNEAHIS
jgi:antibiotic biosynthesis monooxygenase (ABM) superfamily enzyme